MTGRTSGHTHCVSVSVILTGTPCLYLLSPSLQPERAGTADSRAANPTNPSSLSSGITFLNLRLPVPKTCISIPDVSIYVFDGVLNVHDDGARRVHPCQDPHTLPHPCIISNVCVLRLCFVRVPVTHACYFAAGSSGVTSGRIHNGDWEVGVM